MVAMEVKTQQHEQKVQHFTQQNDRNGTAALTNTFHKTRHFAKRNNININKTFHRTLRKPLLQD